MEWLGSIQRIRALKLELARIDPRGGMPVAPPAGAPEHAIAGAERRMGFALPRSYRALLSLHDGWPQVYAGAGLLGVRALSRGTFVDVARMVIDERGAGWSGGRSPAPRGPGRSRQGGLIPFGIDAEAETVFAWDTDAVRPDGEMEVLLWINDLGVRAPSFPALLDLLVDLLSAELEDRRRRAPGAELTPQPRRVAATDPPTNRVRPVPAPRPSASRPVARISALGEYSAPSIRA
jgi:hypothetical protein